MLPRAIDFICCGCADIRRQELRQRSLDSGHENEDVSEIILESEEFEAHHPTVDEVVPMSRSAVVRPNSRVRAYPTHNVVVEHSGREAV